MSYKLQVPFENLTLANGNARTKNTAYLKYSSVSSGSLTRWGSNWVKVGVDENNKPVNGSTLYDIGKIGIKLSNLGLPSILPSGTEIHIQVTSTAKWCGAGYIEGHISFKDLTLNETVEWDPVGGMVQQADLENSRLGYCRSNYGWTQDSSEYYNGPSPEWKGTFSESLELGNNETLYIYMIDTVYNFGNPGSTSFKFNNQTFKVWFILPYTQVGEPSEFALKIDSTKGIAAYDTKIDLSWTAAIDGTNNPVNSYKLWCKPADAEPFIFDSIGNLETAYSYIGYKALPSMVKHTNYQVGIQAMATHENLNSEIVYSPEIISVVNTAPPAPTVSTFSRLRINTDENGDSISTSIAFDECYSEDPDFFYAPESYRNETLKHYYYLSATKNLFKESPEITPKEDEINIVDEDGNECKFLELLVDSQWKATVEMNKDKPWFHVIAQDADGAYSPITSYCVEKNFAAKEPRITLSAATTIVSFDKTKTYTDNIEHITFGLGEDERSFKSVFYLFNENSSEIELGEVDEEISIYSGEEAAYLYTGSIDFSQAGYGNEIKIKVKYTDQYGDTFEVISSEHDENNNLQTNQIYYYPKLMSEIAKNFSMDIWANGWAEEAGILKTYLKSELNNCQLSLILSEDDIPTYVNIYRQSSEDSKYGLLISNTFQDAGSNEKNFTLTNVFKYTDSSNNPVKYKFYYKLSNGFDQSTNYEQYLTNTYQVLPKFNVSEGNFSFSQNNWHPLKIYVDNVIIREGNDEIVEFTCPYNNTKGIGNNRYKIEANCNGNTYILAEEFTGAGNSFWSTSISGSTIEFKANNMEVFKQFGINLNSPTLNVTYKLTGYNAYGVQGDSKAYENCTIITQEAPFFDAMGLVPVINSNATDSYKTWFNPKDKITFSRLQGESLTYPFDYNDYDFDKTGEIKKVKQTIKNYKIYFKYYDDENWKEVSQGAFIYGEDCISFSAPDLAQNNTKTSVIFGVSLLDDTGLESEVQTISEGQTIIKLFACREKNPSLKISGAEIITEQDNQYLSVNLISSDLGGNDTDKENFTRSGAETFSVTIYAATTIEDLNSGRNASVLLSNGVYSESPNNTNLNKNLTARFLLRNNDAKLKEAEKLYIKVDITIITNSVTSQAVNSITTTFLLYLNPPTMAHRAHWIGLNTAEKENDEVFKVMAFKDKKIIRLIGPYSADETLLVSSDDKTLLVSSADERLFDSDGKLLIVRSENQEEAEDMVIEIDLIKGTIYSPDYCLNLKTGEFIGNTLIANTLKIPEWDGKYTGNIDGGTW